MQDNVLSPAKKIVSVYVHTDGTRYFRVNWRDTWEPESHLVSCDELLQDFWRLKNQGPRQNKENEVNSGHERLDDIPLPGSPKCTCGHEAGSDLKSGKIYEERGTQYEVSRTTADSSTQVVTSKTFDRYTQISPCLVEATTQSTSESKQVGIQCNIKCSQIDVSVQFSPTVRDSCVQNVPPCLDESNQYEKSFNDDDDENGVQQREVSLQACPEVTDCGIQKEVALQDQSSQCNEDLFQRTVACQFGPETISCGVQKDSSCIDKSFQYDDPQSGTFTNKSGNVSFVNDKSTLTYLPDAGVNLDSSLYVQPNAVGSIKLAHNDKNSISSTITLSNKCYSQNTDEQCVTSTTTAIQSQSQQIFQNSIASVSLAAYTTPTAAPPPIQSSNEDLLNSQIRTDIANEVFGGGNSTTQYLVNIPDYTSLIEDQALEFSTSESQSETSENPNGTLNNSRMKEMLFVTDAPFELQLAEDQAPQAASLLMTNESIQKQMNQQIIQNSLSALLGPHESNEAGLDSASKELANIYLQNQNLATVSTCSTPKSHGHQVSSSIHDNFSKGNSSQAIQVSDPTDILCPNLGVGIPMESISDEPLKKKRRRSSSEKIKEKSSIDCHNTSRTKGKSRKRKIVVSEELHDNHPGLIQTDQLGVTAFEPVISEIPEQQIGCLDIVGSPGVKVVELGERRNENVPVINNLTEGNPPEEKKINDSFIAKYW